MEITLLLLGSFVLFLPSRYFPTTAYTQMVAGKYAPVLRWASLPLFALAFWAFTWRYDIPTSIVAWLVAEMLILPLVVISIKFSLRWIYGWVAFAGFCILLDVI